MKDFRRYIFLASALVIVYLVAQYNKPKPLDWSATFNDDDKIPHGTYILYHQLKDIFPKASINTSEKTFFSTVSTIKKEKNSSYIIICDAVNFDKHDFEQLKKFVEKGNSVFIAASYFGETFRKEFKIQTQTEFSIQNFSIYLNLVNPNFGNQEYYVDKNCTNGYFFNFDTKKAVILGRNNRQHANFLKFQLGKGALYLNANPLIYTNYSLLQNDGLAYASKSLSYLNPDSNIIWDQFYIKAQDNNPSTMRVFLRHPQLQWSFYIAFFSLLVYVLYQTKRRQRIIPVIEPLSNSSVDFATVVGQVYYEQKDHLNIAQKKISYFLEHIRNRYNMKTAVPDDDFLNTLAKKSGAELTLIKTVFQQIALINSSETIDSRLLIALNTNIEQFYLQAL